MGRQPSLELHDSDSTSRSILERAFREEGWSVTQDDATAPRLAVVVVRSTAAQDGLLRVRSWTERNVPTLVIAEPALKDELAAGGTHEFLPLPVFARDAVTAGKLLAEVSRDGHGDPEVRGPIASFGLYYLLRLMAATRRSGVLQLRRGSRKGELRFASGEVASAQVGPVHGVPAVFQLLLWEHATMTLRLRSVTRRATLGKSTTELLSECERFLRDFLHASRDLGSAQTVYGQAAPETAPLATDVQPVHRLFDGHRTLCDVIGDSPFRIFDTLLVIRRLIDEGAIVRRGDAETERASEQQPAVRPSTLDAWPREDDAAVPAPVADNDPIHEHRGIHGDRRQTGNKIAAAVDLSEERRRRASAPLSTVEGHAQTGRAKHASGELHQLEAKAPPAVVVTSGSIEIAPDVLAAGATVSGDLPAPVPLADNTTEPPLTAREPTTSASAATPPRTISGEIAVPPPAASPQPAHAVEDIPPRDRSLTPTSAFSALEHDFFAREADLYKREKVDTFDDLDGPDHRSWRKKK